jgi:hypothetical protein
MDILKCFIAGCLVIAVIGVVRQLILCFEYEEWKKVYIPVSTALGDSINRVKMLGNLIEGMRHPTLADISEYNEAFAKMKELAAESDRIWRLNPRRVNGKRPLTLIDTVKRFFHKN